MNIESEDELVSSVKKTDKHPPPKGAGGKVQADHKYFLERHEQEKLPLLGPLPVNQLLNKGSSFSPVNRYGSGPSMKRKLDEIRENGGETDLDDKAGSSQKLELGFVSAAVEGGDSDCSTTNGSASKFDQELRTISLFSNS